jgi:TIR domain
VEQSLDYWLIAGLIAVLAAPWLRWTMRRGPLIWLARIVAAVGFGLGVATLVGDLVFSLLARYFSYLMATSIVPVGVIAVGAAAYFGVVGRTTGPPVRHSASPAKAAPVRVRPGSFASPDVFISYKREERPEVLAIAARLEALKVIVWYDAEMRSGTTFDAEIDRNVRAARCVLVCWSPGAVSSDWVRGEATIGRERGVLAACLLKACDLPAPFNLVHANDLRAGVGPHNPEWLAVLGRIGGLLDRPSLAAFEALGQDRAALAAWMAAHPDDPLFDTAVAKLRSL